MYDDYMKWAPEMQERLVSLWRRSYTVLDIADAMGIQYEQAKYGIKRAKSGAWGAEIKARMFFEDAPEAAEAAEEAAPPKQPFKGPTYDIIFRMAKLALSLNDDCSVTKLLADMYTGTASVTFTCGGATFRMSLEPIKEEAACGTATPTSGKGNKPTQ